MPSLQESLLSITTTVSGILELLDDAASSSPVHSSSPRADDNLLPPASYFVAQLQVHLRDVPIEGSLHDGAIQIFLQCCQTARRQVLQRTAKALSQLGGTHERTRALYVNTVQAQFTRGMERGLQIMVDTLNGAVASFQADVDSAAEAESSSESEDGGEGSARGHRAEAVAILERAYAYAQNITQAEKRKLAELTGLEPRQVVIWFQNRRNRKVKTQRRIVIDDDTATAAASAPATPNLKRGREDDEDDEQDDDSQPKSHFQQQLKRLRTTELATPPPQIDRRLFSSSSSSSLTSSIDSGASLLSLHRGGAHRSTAAGSDTTYSSPLSSNSPAEGVSASSSPCASRSAPAPPYLGPTPVLVAPSGETYIFQDDETNMPQLSFDDLQLDPASLNENLKLSFDGLASAGGPSTLAGGWQRSDHTDCTPGLAQAVARQRDNEVTLVPATAYGLAMSLSDDEAMPTATSARSEDAYGVVNLDYLQPGYGGLDDFTFGLDSPFAFSPAKLGLGAIFNSTRQAISDIEADLDAFGSSMSESEDTDIDGEASSSRPGTAARPPAPWRNDTATTASDTASSSPPSSQGRPAQQWSAPSRQDAQAHAMAF